MCGFIATSEKIDMDSFLESISYRGLPGFKGYNTYNGITLGHYSLPFTSPNPQLSIQPRLDLGPYLFVGEVFNFTNCETDIEFIVKKYIDEGLDSFHNFDGFWSFVTIKDESIFAVTDYLSQKPIYYRTDMEALSNEINVLRKFGPVTPDKIFLSNTLKWGYSPDPRTPWNEIKQIPPGHYYHKGHVYPYWNWDIVPCTNLYNDLKEATRLRMGGFREISILLSGGLDSTIIYNLCKELGQIPKAIHIQNGEENFAKLVCPDPITIVLDGISDEDGLKIHQSPVDLGSVKPQIAMGYKLKELGFHAVMTGDGADELFGGYRRSKEYDSQYSDIFCELPYYHLPKLDRTMMWSTVETRSPFLSPSVVKHGLNTIYSDRNGEKKILKKTFESIVPLEILNRDKLPLKTKEIEKSPMEQRLKNYNIWICNNFGE